MFRYSVCSCAIGRRVLLNEIEDVIFREEMMGPSYCISSIDGKIYSPIKGIVTVVFETQHAIMLRSHVGIEVLIHVGIDTVHLAGEGFNLYCDVGSEVNIGDVLLTFDQRKIREHGYSDTVILCLTHVDQYSVVVKEKESIEKIGEPVFILKKRR